MFGLLAALAVALVEYRGVAKAPLPAIIVLFKHMWSKAWKPLLAGVCTAALAAGSAAEFTTKNFGTNARSHPDLGGRVQPVGPDDCS